MLKQTIYALFSILILAVSCTFNKAEADLILYNATIYTVDSVFSQAQALAVKDGAFVSIGSDKEILSHYHSNNTIDAQGLFVYPGFIDGHSHFTGYGEWISRYADLSGTHSFEEVIERLKTHDSLHPSEWLLGKGWDQNQWEDKNFPDNSRLAEEFPNRKILLSRIDGHAVLVSEKVLDISGINADTRIDGGTIKVEDKVCTGLLLDKAAEFARSFIPTPSAEEWARYLLNAQSNCFAVGLTSVTDAGLDKREILFIDSLQQNGDLDIHVNIMINPNEKNLDYFMPQGPICKQKLTIRSVKLYADGALGSRGAKLIEPYNDAPDHTGQMICDRNFYSQVCQRAIQSGFQVCTHAIGDGAVREILHLYSEHLKGSNNLRWRIEHSQVVQPADLGLYKSYSIIPSIQSTHCISDMNWAIDRLGKERIINAYAQKTLLKQNGWLINGTDFPIEDINPIFTFYAAIARKDHNGHPKEGFQPEEALSREEALRSITIWAAKGCFMEVRKGSIEAMKNADFVILDQDIMHCPEENIPNTQVRMTFLEGKNVFSKPIR